jgi:integrase
MMKTTVSIYHEPRRKLPWLVCWWGDPHPETGKQKKYSQSFKYKREALDFQSAKREELRRTGFRDPPKDLTLDQLYAEFQLARLAHLSYGSAVCYENAMVHLRAHFGAARFIRRIDQRHAERFMASLRRRDGRNGTLAEATRAQILRHARTIFNAAVEWSYIAKNPFSPTSSRGASPLRVRAKPRPWQHIKPDQFAAFLGVVPSVQRRAMYWLMYGCGLRPGEVYNVRTDNLDLEARRVYVENRVATSDLPPFTIKAEGTSADSKARSVPIPAAALMDLTAATKASFKSGGFVGLTPQRFKTIRANWRLCNRGQPWSGRKKHRPWQNRDMLNNLLRDTKGYLRKAGIELTAPFTLKTFRKSFAQNHADRGTPPRTLAELLGHSDVSVTMEFYNRVTDANKRAAAQSMDEMFAQAAVGQAEAAG